MLAACYPLIPSGVLVVTEVEGEPDHESTASLWIRASVGDNARRERRMCVVLAMEAAMRLKVGEEGLERPMRAMDGRRQVDISLRGLERVLGWGVGYLILNRKKGRGGATGRVEGAALTGTSDERMNDGSAEGD